MSSDASSSDSAVVAGEPCASLCPSRSIAEGKGYNWETSLLPRSKGIAAVARRMSLTPPTVRICGCSVPFTALPIVQGMSEEWALQASSPPLFRGSAGLGIEEGDCVHSGTAPQPHPTDSIAQLTEGSCGGTPTEAACGRGRLPCNCQTSGTQLALVTLHHPALALCRACVPKHGSACFVQSAQAQGPPKQRVDKSFGQIDSEGRFPHHFLSPLERTEDCAGAVSKLLPCTPVQNGRVCVSRESCWVVGKSTVFRRRPAHAAEHAFWRQVLGEELPTVSSMQVPTPVQVVQVAIHKQCTTRGDIVSVPKILLPSEGVEAVLAIRREPPHPHTSGRDDVVDAQRVAHSVLLGFDFATCAPSCHGRPQCLRAAGSNDVCDEIKFEALNNVSRAGAAPCRLIHQLGHGEELVEKVVDEAAFESRVIVCCSTGFLADAPPMGVCEGGRARAMRPPPPLACLMSHVLE
eukprot:112216-Rhodomonas_salina.4